jgi:hypothetical protein
LLDSFPADFADADGVPRIVVADQANLIVITQSCDLAHGKVSLVAFYPIWGIPACEEAQANHGLSKSAKAWRDYWNHVRNGRSPTLHLLASPITPTEARAALVVDFRAIYSLPFSLSDAPRRATR